MRAISFLGIVGIFVMLCYYIYLQGQQNLAQINQESIRQTPQATDMGAVGDSKPKKDAEPETDQPESAPSSDPSETGAASQTEAPTEEERTEPALPESRFSVTGIWARPAVNPTSAVYLVLENQGTHPDSLVSAHSDIVETIEIHATYEEDGITKMRAETLSLPPGSRKELVPGGTHIMLIGLKKHLIEGESFPLTLVFERGEQTVTVPVGEPTP